MGAPQQYAELDDVAAAAQLLVVLDGVEDPHNLGAIVRTAHAAGAGAVVIPERRAGRPDRRGGQGRRRRARAPAGGARHQYQSHARRLEGSAATGSTASTSAALKITTAVEYNAPTALVFGGEGKGLHEQVRKHCDVLVRIPMAGNIPSLNVRWPPASCCSSANGGATREIETLPHSRIKCLCEDWSWLWWLALLCRRGRRNRCTRGMPWW